MEFEDDEIADYEEQYVIPGRGAKLCWVDPVIVVLGLFGRLTDTLTDTATEARSLLAAHGNWNKTRADFQRDAGHDIERLTVTDE